MESLGGGGSMSGTFVCYSEQAGPKKYKTILIQDIDGKFALPVVFGK